MLYCSGSSNSYAAELVDGTVCNVDTDSVTNKNLEISPDILTPVNLSDAIDDISSVNCSVQSPNMLFVVSMSAESLFIWSTRPLVILARIHRDSSSIEKCGTNSSIIWHAESRQFAVNTTKNYILVYALESYQPAYVADSAPASKAGLNLIRCIDYKVVTQGFYKHTAPFKGYFYLYLC